MGLKLPSGAGTFTCNAGRAHVSFKKHFYDVIPEFQHTLGLFCLGPSVGSYPMDDRFTVVGLCIRRVAFLRAGVK